MYSLCDVKWKTLKSTGYLGIMTNPHIYNTIIIRTKKPIILYVNKIVLSVVIFLNRLVNVPITPWHMRGRHITLFQTLKRIPTCAICSQLIHLFNLIGWMGGIVLWFICFKTYIVELAELTISAVKPCYREHK